MSKQLGALTVPRAPLRPALPPHGLRHPPLRDSVDWTRRIPSSVPKEEPFQFPPSPLHTVGLLQAVVTPTSPQGWTAHHPTGVQRTTTTSASSSGNRFNPSVPRRRTAPPTRLVGLRRKRLVGTSPDEVCTLFTAGGPFTTPLASAHPQSLDQTHQRRRGRRNGGTCTRLPMRLRGMRVRCRGRRRRAQLSSLR